MISVAPPIPAVIPAPPNTPPRRAQPACPACRNATTGDGPGRWNCGPCGLWWPHGTNAPGRYTDPRAERCGRLHDRDGTPHACIRPRHHTLTHCAGLPAPQLLSTREIRVLQLVADGQSNKEIGDALNLSAFTVKTHLSRIGNKLDTGNRTQMVALAMRAGIIH